jgi:hypothetical protein
MSVSSIYLKSVVDRLASYKMLGDKTFAQLKVEDFYTQPNEASNSIAVIISHLSGNMISRWTNFLTEDGEKPWRMRDKEFETSQHSKLELIDSWQKGWNCLFDALASLSAEDLSKTVLIRGETHDVIDAINRHLAHVSYHVGQIVYVGKMLKNENWKNLSIEKGKSEEFNKMKTQKTTQPRT